VDFDKIEPLFTQLLNALSLNNTSLIKPLLQNLEDQLGSVLVSSITEQVDKFNFREAEVMTASLRQNHSQKHSE
jgi:hypothetical protein